MQCNPNKHASMTEPVQQMLNEANNQVKRQRANIRETFKLTNLKTSSLIRNTPYPALEIEALELETQHLLSRLDILLSAHKTDISRFPTSVVADLMVAAGRDRQYAEQWATRNIGTIEQACRMWEGRLSNIKGVFETGRNKGWVKLRKRFIKALGEERVMATETWG